MLSSMLLISLELVSFMNSVTAQSCANGDLELVINPNEQTISGGVLYCYEGTWREICNSVWNENAGTVACTQLGYNYERQTNNTNRITKVKISKVCNDTNATNLQECGTFMQIADIGNCAILVCERVNCSDGEVRLVGGPTPSRGRVEVCVDGRWGTVQTNNPRETAEIVCRQLSQELDFYSNCLGTQFGYRLSKPVYSCDISQNGTLSCHEDKGGTGDHLMDLGVQCQVPQKENATSPCTFSQEGQFRLTNGHNYRAGTVELCRDEYWGVVCSDNHQSITAGAVCSQLGYPSDDAMWHSSLISDERTSYSCVLNNENNHLNCSESTCTHSLNIECSSHKAAVHRELLKCSVSQEDKFRLVNGTAYNEGRVEVCQNGNWRTVCGDNGQTLNDTAKRICSTLGFLEEVPERVNYEDGELGEVYCSAINNTGIMCKPCGRNCNHTLEVVCQTHHQIIQPTTPANCPTSQPPVTVTVSQSQGDSVSPQDCSGSTASFEAVIGVLVIGLMATLVGWTVICVVVWRRDFKAHTQRPSGIITLCSENYTFQREEPAAISHQYSSLRHNNGTPITNHDEADHYDVNHDEADHYDVIDLNGRSPNTPQAVYTLVRDEAEMQGDDFYDAEEHAYSVVQKKKRKSLRSEDDEGEMEESHVYDDVTIPAAILRGGDEEEYSKLQH